MLAAEWFNPMTYEETMSAFNSLLGDLTAIKLMDYLMGDVEDNADGYTELHCAVRHLSKHTSGTTISGELHNTAKRTAKMYADIIYDNRTSR